MAEARAIDIADVATADRDWLLALNQACLPAVSSLDMDALDALLAEAAVARTARIDDTPAGALIAFRPGATYASDNYRWFCDRFDDFLYVDRVMVSETARGSGVGAVLYDDIAGVAKQLAVPRITCEVNEVPPNPCSMRFHERHGFRVIESRASAGGSKRVVMLERPTT